MTFKREDGVYWKIGREEEGEDEREEEGGS